MVKSMNSSLLSSQNLLVSAIDADYSPEAGYDLVVEEKLKNRPIRYRKVEQIDFDEKCFSVKNCAFQLNIFSNTNTPYTITISILSNQYENQTLNYDGLNKLFQKFPGAKNISLNDLKNKIETKLRDAQNNEITKYELAKILEDFGVVLSLTNCVENVRIPKEESGLPTNKSNTINTINVIKTKFYQRKEVKIGTIVVCLVVIFSFCFSKNGINIKVVINNIKKFIYYEEERQLSAESLKNDGDTEDEEKIQQGSDEEKQPQQTGADEQTSDQPQQTGAEQTSDQTQQPVAGPASKKKSPEQDGDTEDEEKIQQGSDEEKQPQQPVAEQTSDQPQQTGTEQTSDQTQQPVAEQLGALPQETDVKQEAKAKPLETDKDTKNGTSIKPNITQVIGTTINAPGITFIVVNNEEQPNDGTTQQKLGNGGPSAPSANEPLHDQGNGNGTQRLEQDPVIMPVTYRYDVIIRVNKDNFNSLHNYCHGKKEIFKDYIPYKRDDYVTFYIEKENEVKEESVMKELKSDILEYDYSIEKLLIKVKKQQD